MTARAAAKGLVPAQFRYASMLEKGQGVKKDLVHARRLYLAAAAKGNGKAMHNLAVLYAEGIEGRPDYSNPAQWFRKAPMPRTPHRPDHPRALLAPRARLGLGRLVQDVQEVVVAHLEDVRGDLHADRVALTQVVIDDDSKGHDTVLICTRLT